MALTRFVLLLMFLLPTSGFGPRASDRAAPESAKCAIPPRPKDALTGSQFINAVKELSREEREQRIAGELLRGNIPDFLRSLKTITATASSNDGTTHTLTFEVMPDYLAIGSDEDFVRMPMNPYTAERFLDAYGFVFPTAKMVDDIWANAGVRLDPYPLIEERESAETFYRHHQIIEKQRGDAPNGEVVAGIKKDVVVSNRLLERSNRVAIYGWHYTTGKPIQPLTTVHVDWYVDYSHGVRPVCRMMMVDGKRLSFEEIATDPELHMLVSNEGLMKVFGY